MALLIDIDRQLRAMIAECEPGDALPSATELRRRCNGASFGQLRRVLDRLEDEGLVKRRARKVWVAPRPGPPTRSSTREELDLRADLIGSIRRVGLTSETLARRPVAEVVALAGTGDPELAHQRLRIAALTLRSPHAEVIRSALGLDERTRGAETMVGRREVLAAELGQPVQPRHERAGAQELAWHVESILALEIAGVVDFDWGRQSPHEMLRDVLRRLDRLERLAASQQLGGQRM